MPGEVEGIDAVKEQFLKDNAADVEVLRGAVSRCQQVHSEWAWISDPALSGALKLLERGMGECTDPAEFEKLSLTREHLRSIARDGVNHVVHISARKALRVPFSLAEKTAFALVKQGRAFVQDMHERITAAETDFFQAFGAPHRRTHIHDSLKSLIAELDAVEFELQRPRRFPAFTNYICWRKLDSWVNGLGTSGITTEARLAAAPVEAEASPEPMPSEDGPVVELSGPPGLQLP